MTRQPWNDADRERVRAEYPDTTTKALAESLGRSESSVYQLAFTLGLRKSAAYLASPAAFRFRRSNPKGEACRFKPGHVTWNAGAKGWQAGGRSTETQFKKGMRPHTWKPVGYERVSKDGYLERKVSEPRTFRAVHVVVWEENNGPVPKGHAVCFLPGRKSTDADAINIDALELVSRAELMRRNSYHTRYPKEVARLIQLRGALNRKINRMEAV